MIDDRGRKRANRERRDERGIERNTKRRFGDNKERDCDNIVD